MANNKKAFGDFLRTSISQSDMSQAAFYTAVEITKPYFYDILSGKVNPPPADVQYRMIEVLGLNKPEYKQQRNKFLNLAAKGRNEIPADIADLIKSNSDKLEEIRKLLTQLLEKGHDI